MYIVHVGKSHNEPAPNHHLLGPAADFLALFPDRQQFPRCFPGYAGPRSCDDRAASAEAAAGQRRPKETADASQGVTTGGRFLGRHWLNMWMTC